MHQLGCGLPLQRVFCYYTMYVLVFLLLHDVTTQCNPPTLTRGTPYLQTLLLSPDRMHGVTMKFYVPPVCALYNHSFTCWKAHGLADILWEISRGKR